MPQLITLTLSDLVEHAQKWDDLWTSGEAGRPSERAEGIQLWCRTFTPDAEFMALVVEEGDQFVAALPLIKDNKARLLSVYRLPSNDTVSSGDLLIRPDCDAQAAIKLLADGVSKLPGTLAAFENIRVHTERWQSLLSELQSKGNALHVSRGHDVGVVDILHDWDAYHRSWSRNHRSAIKRSRKKLEAEGNVEVERLRDPSDGELHEVLESCFAIEDLGWKGEHGTSILKTPGLREYFHQEARMMRDFGMLDLWLLKVNDKIIAFEYCHYAKSTCFSHKISFDPAWERFSPGRVLRCIQLEQYHEDPSAQLLDTLGLLCEAKAKWITRSYTSSRCFIAVGGGGSNLLLRGFQVAKRLVGKLRPADAPGTTIKPGAEKYLELADKKKRAPDAAESPLTLPIDCPTMVTAAQQSLS